MTMYARPIPFPERESDKYGNYDDAHAPVTLLQDYKLAKDDILKHRLASFPITSSEYGNFYRTTSTFPEPAKPFYSSRTGRWTEPQWSEQTASKSKSDYRWRPGHSTRNLYRDRESGWVYRDWYDDWRETYRRREQALNRYEKALVLSSLSLPQSGGYRDDQVQRYNEQLRRSEPHPSAYSEPMHSTRSEPAQYSDRYQMYREHKLPPIRTRHTSVAQYPKVPATYLN